MLTPIRKFSTAKFAPPAAIESEGTRGPLPRWDFCSPFSRPHFRAPSREGPWLRSFFIFPAAQKLAAWPRTPKNKSAKKNVEGASSVLHFGKRIVLGPGRRR